MIMYAYTAYVDGSHEPMTMCSLFFLTDSPCFLAVSSRFHIMTRNFKIRAWKQKGVLITFGRTKFLSETLSDIDNTCTHVFVYSGIYVYDLDIR